MPQTAPYRCPETKTPVLPYVDVTAYDLKNDPVRRCFANTAAAERWIEQTGTKIFNVYRIEKVNGTWRTDW